jgi:hypothetical protein
MSLQRFYESKYYCTLTALLELPRGLGSTCRVLTCVGMCASSLLARPGTDTPPTPVVPPPAPPVTPHSSAAPLPLPTLPVYCPALSSPNATSVGTCTGSTIGDTAFCLQSCNPPTVRVTGGTSFIVSGGALAPPPPHLCDPRTASRLGQSKCGVLVHGGLLGPMWC